MKFTEQITDNNILKALSKLGFTEMTPIQEKTYPIIHSGRDLCALAETGSGKTAACAIPLVEKINVEEKTLQALILVPTRELCIQYVEEIQNISVFTPVVPFAAYGGFDKDIQASKIRDGIHVLVATPGRLIDLLYSGSVSFSHIKCAILDEADELLKEGFEEDIAFIMSCIRHEVQTLLFSATMPDAIRHLAETYLKDPEQISLVEKQKAPVSLQHCFIDVAPKMKQQRLEEYLKTEKITQAIIFCNSRHMVDKLFGDLKKIFSDVEYIHAGLDQDKRSSIFRRFKGGKIKFLLATDVAGRGLDFSKVSHVINWELPDGREQYTHRTGRAGRMGRTGTAVTFISRRDYGIVQSLINRNHIKPVWIGKNPLTDSQQGRGQEPHPGKGSGSHPRQGDGKEGYKKDGQKPRRQDSGKGPYKGGNTPGHKGGADNSSGRGEITERAGNGSSPKGKYSGQNNKGRNPQNKDNTKKQENNGRNNTGQKPQARKPEAPAQKKPAVKDGRQDYKPIPVSSPPQDEKKQQYRIWDIFKKKSRKENRKD